MRALVYTGPQAIEFQEAPEPTPGASEVLIQVEAVGICGSDMHTYLGHDARRPPPLILGHEASGRALTGRYQGRRVVVNPLVSCGTCDFCLGGRANVCRTRQIISIPPRQGAFAEQVAVPERNVLPVPEGVSAAAAALTEPIATSLHAIDVAERALWRPLGEARQVLVLGGGAIGLAAALLLRARGVREVWVGDTNPKRRQTVERAGAFRVYDPAAETPPEDAFALVVDAVGGRRTREAGSAAVMPGGVLVHIGLMDADNGLDIRKFTLQEVAFIGTYTYTMVDFRATLDAIHAGQLGALDWIEQRALEEGPAAFRDLLDGRTSAAKVILTP